MITLRKTMMKDKVPWQYYVRFYYRKDSQQYLRADRIHWIGYFKLEDANRMVDIQKAKPYVEKVELLTAEEWKAEKYA